MIECKGKNPSDLPNLVRVKDAAAYMKVTPKAIHDWIADGRLTRYSMGPRHVLIDLDEATARMRNYGHLPTR